MWVMVVHAVLCTPEPALTHHDFAASLKSCALLTCSSLYTTKAVVNSMASGLGPLVSVVLFALLGNRWEVSAYPTLSFILAAIVQQTTSLACHCARCTQDTMLWNDQFY